MQGKDRYQLIQVRYRSDREGHVDSITLNELIESKKISHFYRPSENRWVDISVDPLRRRGETKVTGRFQRASDWEEKDEEKEEKPRGLFARLFRRKRKPPTPKELSAREWLDQGFVLLQTTDDYEGAIRAFAHSIHLNPRYERAYVNRALAYERLGNVQQAIEDFTRAVFVNPDAAKVYYLRGLAFRQLGMDAEAVADLKKASDLRYRPAYDFLKSMGMSW